MGRLIDLTGETFGKLTVEGRAPSNRWGSAMWACRCACGNAHTVEGAILRRGNSTNCGCVAQGREVRPGRQFGDLTVRERVKRGGKFGHSVWRCACACGRSHDASASNLLTGRIRSCGCKRVRSLELAGRDFGRLHVLERANPGEPGPSRWLCLCACGERPTIVGTDLACGQTISCGCARSGRNPMLRSEAVRLKDRVRVQARRARRRATGGTHTLEDIADRFVWQRGRCAMPWCRAKLTPDGRRVDHIEPLSPRRRGGVQKPNLNGRRNLQLTCDPCNREKRDRDPIEHSRAKGYLL